MLTFSAFRATGGNVLFPDRFEVDDDVVTFYKGKIFGYYKTIIQRSAIASVNVDAGVLFATITVETKGGKTIIGNGFTNSDAREFQASV